MSWKSRWGWARHGTNTQTTAHTETREEEERRGRRLRQDPAALRWQRVERWRREESESPVSVIPLSAQGTALESVVALKVKGPGLLHGGQEGR